jgi:hypothetical protein
MFKWLFGKKKNQYVIRILGTQNKDLYTVEGEIVKFESVEAAGLVAKTIERSTVVVLYDN